ncbi:hypothetical protein THAOC_20107, partial [Thalassiosira oceanica]
QDLRLRRLERDKHASKEGNVGIVRGLGERETLAQREESPTRREGVLDVVPAAARSVFVFVEIKGHQLLRSSTEDSEPGKNGCGADRPTTWAVELGRQSSSGRLRDGNGRSSPNRRTAPDGHGGPDGSASDHVGGERDPYERSNDPGRGETGTGNRNVGTTDPESIEHRNGSNVAAELESIEHRDRSDDNNDGAGGGGGTPLARRVGAEEIREAPGAFGSAVVLSAKKLFRQFGDRLTREWELSGFPRNRVARQESEMEGSPCAAGTNRVARQESEIDGPSCAAGTAPRTRIDNVAGAVVGDRNDSRRGLGVDEPVRSEGDVSLDPSSNADDDGDIERSIEVVKGLQASDFDISSLEDSSEDEPTPVQRVDPSEGDAPDPPGNYDSSERDAPDPPGIYPYSDATSGERGLESIASTEISSLPTTEHSNVTARGSGGLDPPSRALPTDNGVDDGDGQLDVLTISGDPQQQQSCLDPPFIETVENKQPTHDHELVTEPSKSIRLALWGLWSGLVRLVGSGLGLALLLASGWFIGLSLNPLNRNSIQQHLIMPSVPSSFGGNALEVQHLTLTMPFVAGGNLSRYANESLPSTLPVQLMSFPSDGEDFIASAGCESDETVPSLRVADDVASGVLPVHTNKSVALYANNTNDMRWEVENELQWEAEIEINDADETPKEIEINNGLPSLSSPSSLRTIITKPTNDDAICDDTRSMPDDRVSEGDERVVGPTPVNDDALISDPSSTSLVDRVSEGDERVVTAYTADYSLLPTSTSMMAHDSEPEGDGNFFSSDSDGVYVPEGEVYYMNGDRLADDDSQLPFGFVKTYGSLALLGFADYLTIYLRNSVDDVEIPSTDLQCELPMSEFQVWSKVIRSCGLSLEVEADSPQPAIEFSRNRAIERPWDVWIRKFIHFFYERTNYLHLRAIIEQEGVTCGLHFAQIQLRESFFSLTSLQRDDDLPFTINCFKTHLQIATWIPVRYLDTFDFLAKLQNGILQLREGVLR